MKSIQLVLLVVCLTLNTCAGEVDPPDKDGHQTLDQKVPTPDTQPSLEGTLGQCKDGDKRCATLFMIQECKNGAWVDFIDCSQKKLGSDMCKCSMTLLYKCSVGANLCN